MTAVVVALAIIGALNLLSMVGLAVWCWFTRGDHETVTGWDGTEVRVVGGRR